MMNYRTYKLIKKAKGLIALHLLLIMLMSAAAFPQKISKIGASKKFNAAEGAIVGNNNVSLSKAGDSKVSPVIRYIISKAELNKNKLNKAGTETFIKSNSFASLSTDVTGKLSLQIFVKSDNISPSLASISSFGGTVQTVAGDIIVAEVPVDYITDIASSPEISFIDASTKSKPLLNESGKEISVDKVHAGNSLPKSYKGNGVIVGIVDSGIDWQHDDFKTSTGNRIQYIWDMSSTGNPPAEYNYGTEYTKANLDANSCQESDNDDGGGHGTHVAGTAAGNGNALAGYVGMAPESEIVFVKGFHNGPGFENADVVNGCNYIFSKAADAGKPAVINLSLGGHVGAHDGSSLYEQALSNLTGPGKIIVAAAGNEGSNYMHVGYNVTGSGLEEVSQTYWVVPQGSQSSLVDMWYSSGNIAVGIAAYDGNNQLVGYTAPVLNGQKIENLPFTVNGVTYGVVTIDATTTADPNNGAKRVFLAIDSNQGQINLNSVYWVLYTYGSGSFDAWLVSGGYFTVDENAQNKIVPGDNNKSIGMPGTAKKVICVGSYVTKNQWIDIDGNTQSQNGNPAIGQISSFSSLGPSRDGRVKPDITAPGEVIVAALSSTITISNDATPRSHIQSGGKLQKMQGTSMATPHVTGVIALMLEAKPNLDYDETLTILKNTARKDNFTGQNANNTFGSGKLDAYNAVKAVAGTGSGGNQVTIFENNFDASFLPLNWTQRITNAANTWLHGNPEESNFNTIDPASTASAICPWVAQDQDEWIITSPFSLGQGSASIEFYAGYSTQWLSAATLKLNISVDGGVSWTQIWSAENDGQGWTWRKKTIDLTSYSGKSNLKLGWQYIGNDGDLAGIDAIKLTGISSSTDVYTDNHIPSEFNIMQNYPNPFNPSTVIEVHVPETEKITLKVYDLLGSEVAVLMNEEKSAGIYKINFDGSNLASGLYYYTVSAGNFHKTIKMMLIK